MRLLLGFLMGMAGLIGMIVYGLAIVGTLFAITHDTVINDEATKFKKPQHKYVLRASLKMFGFYLVIFVIALIILITL